MSHFRSSPRALRLERTHRACAFLLLHLRRKRRVAVLRTAVPGLFPRKWKMTRKTSQRRTNRNYNRNPNTRRVAWDDLRAMTPIEPHTDFSKPPIGYVLDDDGNYPECIREVF